MLIDHGGVDVGHLGALREAIDDEGIQRFRVRDADVQHVQALIAVTVRPPTRQHIEGFRNWAADLREVMSVFVVAGGSEPYEDADGVGYLPLLVQPLLVFEASGDQMRRARSRAAKSGVALAIYTAHMFSTGNDAENRAAVRAVTAENLDLVGIGIRTNHRDADAVVRGLARHP